MRLGLVGYGVGGRCFHAPFIAAARGVELAGVVTRSPDRVFHNRRWDSNIRTLAAVIEGGALVLGRTDCRFTVSLTHTDGVHSRAGLPRTRGASRGHPRGADAAFTSAAENRTVALQPAH